MEKDQIEFGLCSGSQVSVRENQNTATSLPTAAKTAVSLELAVEAKNRSQRRRQEQPRARVAEMWLYKRRFPLSFLWLAPAVCDHASTRVRVSSCCYCCWAPFSFSLGRPVVLQQQSTVVPSPADCSAAVSK